MKKINFRKLLIITSLIFFASIFIFSSFGSVNNDEKNEKRADNFPQNYKIVTPKIPEKLEFCGEPVPVNNFEVYERLEREFIVNTYWHSLTILTLKQRKSLLILSGRRLSRIR